jgi:asparagine synthase (glutamine-hydrolysing)
MCGFVSVVTAPGKSVPGAVLRRMTDVLSHRGPDDMGFAWVNPSTGAVHTTRDLAPDTALSGVLFGHRRLSILDLSTAGSQPMVSDDRLSLLCFNGEIYNFVELRDELRAHGVAFRGTGDTEVLLKAYEQWGSGAFNRLNGMWAFTLWDGRRRALIASRDRFGVKPLYWATVDGCTILASEIKGLLGYPGAFRGVEDRKVLSFLRDGATDQDDETMFGGIRSLPAGTYLELTEGHRVTRPFWSLSTSVRQAQGSPDELIGDFGRLLAESVHVRVRSDVPIGTMMSGGLDSTAITALIRAEQLHAGADRFQGLEAFHHTFSACWPGSASDEEAAIDLMCRELGLVSHKLYPSPEAVADVLPQVIYHLDEPFVDPISAVQYLLMREARGCGVKVVLNGHGSDELLAGYHNHFVPVFLADLLLTGRLRNFIREQRAFRGTGWPWVGVLWSLLLRLLPGQVRMDPAIPHRALERLRGSSGVFVPLDGRSPDRTGSIEPRPRLSHLNTRLWFEFATRNLPRWLRMEDRMSMASSVESRLPFMDYRLVEFAFSLPDDIKLRDGYNKYILRQSMRNLLPRHLTETRTKLPFKAPFAEWLRGAWRPMIQDLLVGTGAVRAYLDYPRFRAKLESYLVGNDRSLPTYLIWRVLHTELWLRMVRDRFGAISHDGHSPAPHAQGLPA